MKGLLKRLPIFRTESDEVRHAMSEAKTREQLKEEMKRARPKKFGLPTSWANQDKSIVIRGNDTEVIRPNAHEVKSFGEDIPFAVCGECAHWDLEAGQKEMLAQQFAERLVREQQWKMRHLGAPVDNLGLCGMSNGDTVCSFVARACDQFKPYKGGRRG